MRTLAGLLLALACTAALAQEPSVNINSEPPQPPTVETSPQDLAASLPDLGGSEPDLFQAKPRPLPGSRVPVIEEPYPHLFEPPGPPPYWRTDPLYASPAP